MNQHAFAQLDRFGLAYASDGRAPLRETGALATTQAGPHRISWSGETSPCIQLPTTLPTMDELLGRSINGVIIDESNIAALILGLTETPRDHVFTLHAELEGRKLAPIFDKLLSGWQAQGYNLGSMADLYKSVRGRTLPISPVSWGKMPGRSGELIVQAG